MISLIALTTWKGPKMPDQQTFGVGEAVAELHRVEGGKTFDGPRPDEFGGFFDGYGSVHEWSVIFCPTCGLSIIVLIPTAASFLASPIPDDCSR
jgi:hypothetical protein